ncbi:PLP-dependent lyase/thiolase [Nocardia sp. NPDC049149]|uniref:PLP-dependent lyase/thiolase n=1 Tax=Nocardia sp. NPDC049149 TaxID=3364315 RepID=UPI003717BCB1
MTDWLQSRGTQHGKEIAHRATYYGDNWPTPLRELDMPHLGRRVYVKDEAANVTGTFKDRLTATLVRSISEPTLVGLISYGNTALSLVNRIKTCPDFGQRVRVLIYVPSDLDSWTLGPTSLGTTVKGTEILSVLSRHDCVRLLPIPADGAFLDDAAIERAARTAFNDRSSPFVNITEGTDTPSYEIIGTEIIDQLGAVPDLILTPFGAGMLANETRDLVEDPDQRVLALSVGNRNSLARMLYGPFWLDVAALNQIGYGTTRHSSPDRLGRIRQPYRVHRVDEDQIHEALARCAKHSVCAEPSGAVPFTFESSQDLPVDFARDEPYQTVVLINTGNSIDYLRRSRGRSGEGFSPTVAS